MTITRRDLLRGLAAGTAGVAFVGCGYGAAPEHESTGPDAQGGRVVTPPSDTPESPAMFPLGVSAGDLAGDRGILWTRYTGTAPLVAFAWRVENEAFLEELGPFSVTPADGYAHVPIAGLRAGARYRYAFFQLDGDPNDPQARVVRSRVGQFRAPIADDALEPLTFGAICCIDKARGTGPLARAAARTDFDAMIFLGDSTYCDAEDLAKYRQDYAEHWIRTEFADLRANAGQYITWDDHEVANNWDPETIAPDRLAAAFTAFFDHAPIAKVAGDERRIWRSARWGKTVEVFVLDTRGERKPSTRGNPDEQYISPAQLAWLKAGLAASPAVFKLIMNTVPITHMPNVWNTVPGDRWDGYKTQRAEILRYIDDHAITGVTWLAGDFHLAFMANVGSEGDPGARQHEILCGPGGANGNPLGWSLTKPRFSFETNTNNYVALRFDPAARTIAVDYINAEGTPFHAATLTM